ncbi:TetR/AcrR family transcriptional regulator [Nocardia jejuensis]|uniref:TetR/AcrR family transcriptional regulator n=1 Tax=Nocardia jejuensis TaxID=328049 RepID=UPI00082D015A|nr:TetR/AcrR family transcriptional regulator [Nocardia jejuensis]
MSSGSVRVATTRPVRGTRPSNRRALIIAAAEEMFYRDGYAAVSMSGVAEAVAVGPSALYRHFSSKHDLLAAVVEESLSAVGDVLDRARTDSPDLLTRVAATALEFRRVGVLWRRESRHLAESTRAEIQDQVLAISARLTEIVRDRRPELRQAEADLLAWALLAVATSISFHGLKLPAERFTRVLASMLEAVCSAEFAALGPRSPRRTPAPRWYPSRRAEIISAATELIAQRGYSSVGMEDIGAAVGIAGASIYKHFAGKAEILVEVLDQGSVILRADLIRALDAADSAQDALRALVVAYSTYVLTNPALFGLLALEVDILDPAEHRRIRDVQLAYVAEWVQLVRQIHPDQDAVEARIRVQAVLGVVNDLASTPHVRAHSDVGAAIVAVCATLLGIQPPRQGM